MFERVAGKQCDDLIGARKAAMRALIGRKRRDILTEQFDASRRRDAAMVSFRAQGSLEVTDSH